MDDPGHRRAAAGMDVGDGARDRAGRAVAAEQGRGDIGDALRHQFLIGIVSVADQPIRHPRAQQGFNRAEKRNCYGRPYQILNDAEINVRESRYAAARKECRRNRVPMVSTGR